MKTMEKAIMNQVISWRRHIHENPELSYQEHNTSDYIYNLLSTFPGLEVTKPTETSVLAVLRGSKKTDQKNYTIAFRADIDALPIQEEADVDFKSKNPGVMHACGHDAHAAMLLGAAKILSEKGRRFLGKSDLSFNMLKNPIQEGHQN